MASTAGGRWWRWVAIKRAASWARHGVGYWPVFAVVFGIVFAVGALGRWPRVSELGAIGVGIAVWYAGWYAGRVAELLRVRAAAREGRAEYGHTVTDAERRAMMQVWRDERYLGEQLYTPAKMLTTGDPHDMIAERFARSQLAAAVLLYERAHAAQDAVIARYDAARARKDTLS